MLTGIGDADLRPPNEEYSLEDDNFFVVEPTLLAELNLGRSVRADVGATWRFVRGLELPGLDEKDLSGPTVMLLVKFGSFR